MTSRRSRSNQINQATLSILADRAKDMDTKVESPRLKEPAKATPYLDPKHICAYDGPVKGCVCQSE